MRRWFSRKPWGSSTRSIAARTEAIFRQSGALTDGHFRLKSGRHSERYLEKFLVLQDPAATGELCAFWTARYRDAEQECAAFHKRTGRIIKLLTVQEILDEEHVQKM